MVDTVRVEVAVAPDERLKLVGFTEAVGPAGETEVFSVAAPANPLKLDNIMVDVPEDPAVRMRLEELAATPKSGNVDCTTLTLIATE